jgi:hypothetical protein
VHAFAPDETIPHGLCPDDLRIDLQRHRRGADVAVALEGGFRTGAAAFGERVAQSMIFSCTRANLDPSFAPQKIQNVLDDGTGEPHALDHHAHGQDASFEQMLLEQAPE